MWKTMKLGDICDISIGKTPSRSDKRYWDSEKQTNNVWLSIADLTSLTDKYVSDSKEYITDEGASLFKPVPKNTLVMSFKLSIGKLAFTQCELRTNEAIAALPIKDENLILKEFLYHYLSSLNWDSIAGKDEKVKGKTLNKKKLSELNIVLPPLAEQQRVVAKLDAAFAEIEEAIISSEEAYSKARNLYQQELSNTFSNSNEGWIDTTIGECCSLKSGNTLNKNLEQDVGEVPYLKVADMNLKANIGGIKTSSRFVSKTAVSEKAFIKSGSVIFPKRGGAIATNKKRLTLVDICADLNIMSVQPNSSILSELLYYYFQNIDMAKLGSGSSIPQINNYDIEPLRISYPNDAERQRDLINHLSSLESLSEKLAQTYLRKIDELTKLKFAILAQELNPSEAA